MKTSFPAGQRLRGDTMRVQVTSCSKPAPFGIALLFAARRHTKLCVPRMPRYRQLRHATLPACASAVPCTSATASIWCTAPIPRLPINGRTLHADHHHDHHHTHNQHRAASQDAHYCPTPKAFAPSIWNEPAERRTPTADAHKARLSIAPPTYPL
jgi:hypothetical protein